MSTELYLGQNIFYSEIAGKNGIFFQWNTIQSIINSCQDCKQYCRGASNHPRFIWRDFPTSHSRVENNLYNSTRYTIFGYGKYLQYALLSYSFILKKKWGFFSSFEISKFGKSTCKSMYLFQGQDLVNDCRLSFWC